MIFRDNIWWDDYGDEVPDGLKYLFERWWELLQDKHVNSYYSPSCSYVVSIMEDTINIIDDLQGDRLRSSHALDNLLDELEYVLKTNSLINEAFSTERDTVLDSINNLRDELPERVNIRSRYSSLKKRKMKIRKVEMSIRRLHARCMRRYQTEDNDETSMTWKGLSGLAGSKLKDQIFSDSPNYNLIDDLISEVLLDWVYRGYHVNYLSSILDRMIAITDEEVEDVSESLKDGFIHVFRRIHTSSEHRHEVFAYLVGIRNINVEREEESELSVWSREDVVESVGNMDDVNDFLDQYTSDTSVIVSVERKGDPDAAAAAKAARAQFQEFVDYLDFKERSFEGIQVSDRILATYEVPSSRSEAVEGDTNSDTDSAGIRTRLYEPGDHSRSDEGHWSGIDAHIEAKELEELTDLSEALRWMAVAQREPEPEVSLFASWLAFEFLAGEFDQTAIGAITEFFPKALAVGNIRRRLRYWWRCLRASHGFDTHDESERILDYATLHGGGADLENILEMLLNRADESIQGDVNSIVNESVLLRERRNMELESFGNPQKLAEDMKINENRLRWDFQRFFTVRNKLVHRARVDHKMLVLISRRASSLLDELLWDISVQISSNNHLLDNNLTGIFYDYRDTYNELKKDLGKNDELPDYFVERILLM